MPNISLQAANLDINQVLTNLAQGVKQHDLVMRVLFPFTEVAEYSGQLIQFDRSIYQVVDDDRADATPYAKVQDGYTGRPFQLATKGFSYEVGDKKARRQAALRINWGQRAVNRMLSTAGLLYEVQCAAIATNLSNYSVNNRETLAPGAQISDPTVDPGPIIRRAKSRVSGQIGTDPNVWTMGQEVFDALCENRYIIDKIKYTSADSVTEEILAAMYGFKRVVVCKAIRLNDAGDTERVFGKHMVFARTNPAALEQDRLPYRPNGQIDAEEPAYGYGYVYQGNPLVYNPVRDEKLKSTTYLLDFDRSVAPVGVDNNNKITYGYMVANAAA
jgi:hypothetical protein